MRYRELVADVWDTVRVDDGNANVPWGDEGALERYVSDSADSFVIYYEDAFGLYMDPDCQMDDDGARSGESVTDHLTRYMSAVVERVFATVVADWAAGLCAACECRPGAVCDHGCHDRAFSCGSCGGQFSARDGVHGLQQGFREFTCRDCDAAELASATDEHTCGLGMTCGACARRNR